MPATEPGTAERLDFSHIPRVVLAHLPTPLEFMSTMSSKLNGIRLFIKRDDCTGLGLGGSKTRKLEFSLGAARAAGADTIITSGAWQSNHVRQTAAAAAQIGMAFHAVLSNPVDRTTAMYSCSGNLLLDRLFGAELHFVTDDGEATADRVELITMLERAAGRVPYIVPLGASDGVGALGYAVCAQELLTQCHDQGVRPSAIVLATGSGGTQAGLLAGLRLLGSKITVIGISVSEPAAAKWVKVRSVSDQMLDLLDAPREAVPDDQIIVHGDYVGDGYAVADQAANAAVRWAAETEAVLLDPVYTGKAMAGLLDLAGQGSLQGDVIFLHTGGAPALFAYADEFVPAEHTREDSL